MQGGIEGAEIEDAAVKLVRLELKPPDTGVGSVAQLWRLQRRMREVTESGGDQAGTSKSSGSSRAVCNTSPVPYPRGLNSIRGPRVSRSSFSSSSSHDSSVVYSSLIRGLEGRRFGPRLRSPRPSPEPGGVFVPLSPTRRRMFWSKYPVGKGGASPTCCSRVPVLRDRLLEALELGWHNGPAGGYCRFSSGCMLVLVVAFAANPAD